MGRLSELWFRLTEKITTIIFSFIFFWSALVYFANISDGITHYLTHLSEQTRNYGYSAIGGLVKFVSFIVYIILILMPFAITGAILRGDNVDKKRHILRFFLRLLLFWRRFF